MAARRTYLTVVAVLATMALAAPAAQAQTAMPSQAQAAQAETACGPGSDWGDRLVPDSGPWFNFTTACARHDACYAAQTGRAGCDTRFREDMYAHCATRRSSQRSACRHTADVYYEAVNRFGGYFY